MKGTNQKQQAHSKAKGNPSAKPQKEHPSTSTQPYGKQRQTGVTNQMRQQVTITKVPEAPGTKVPEVPGTKVPEAPGTKVLKAPGTKVPEAPGTKVPEAPGTKVLKAPGTKVPDAPGTKVLKEVPTHCSEASQVRMEAPKQQGERTHSSSSGLQPSSPKVHLYNI